MYNVKITDTFARETKKLAKKYRRIKKDFSPLLEQLEAGQFVGDAVSGFDNKLYKVSGWFIILSRIKMKFYC
jgi:mRNA-degrading endonuclease RelE of RelBE toxin-antitoxin system